MRRLINSLCASLFVSHLPTTMAQAQSVLDGAQPPATTFLCRFTDGPRAGGTQQLLGTSGRVTVRAGSSCSDGISSTGVVIVPQASAELASANTDAAPARQAELTYVSSQAARAPERSRTSRECPELRQYRLEVPAPMGHRPRELPLLPRPVQPRSHGAVPYKAVRPGRNARPVRFVNSCPAPKPMGGMTMPRCRPRRSVAHVETA